MALPKRHWGNAAQTPGFIPGAACGRDPASFERELIVTSATSFNGSAAKNPDWYCVTCTKAARLALAAESAPKPDAAIWPKPRPISEAPHKTLLLVRVPGLRPEWTMGLFDCCWVDMCCAKAEIEPTHFLPLPPEVMR